jgi:hypothetical protein
MTLRQQQKTCALEDDKPVEVRNIYFKRKNKLLKNPQS